MIELVTSVFRSFRVQDFFDIIFISIFIYALWMWFSVAASRFVLLGIAFLGVIYMAARYFQMYLTALVLQGFFAVLMVALVVIFQEEIRRFFERLATWKGFTDSRKKEGRSREIEIICQTAARLAQKRTGALIVISGRDPIDRHLSGGVPLSGELSEAVLESIFDPHSVGHDGAVVVEDGRISRFACQLPLSGRAREFGLMGLRHTAALGLSEVSDALCVVVSEERGAISVARDERIERLEDPNSLSDILEAYYAALTPVRKKRRVLGWFQSNFRAKAAALAISVILWLSFGLQSDMIRREFIFPIEYRNLASDWVIESATATEAHVYLSGPRQAFQILDPNALKISVDLAGIEEGEQDVVLGKGLMRLPASLTVESVKPGSLEFSAYRLRPTRVPVEVNVVGKTPRGVSLVSVTPSPREITVLAPRKGKKRLKIFTEPVDISLIPVDHSTVSETTAFSPPLQVPADIRFPGGKAPAVTVTVRVRASSP